MKESLAGTLSSQQQLQPLCTLKTLAEGSGKKDQQSLNNIVFMVQQLTSTFSLYNDFHGSGKLGVSSPKLGWDYSRLSEEWDNIEQNISDEYMRDIEKLARIFFDVSWSDIGLVACLLFDRDFLGKEAQLKAKEILKEQIKKKIGKIT